MSKTIDERIVSMQFDNRQFESNVKTSLSTIDKLKQSLKLDGVSKSLENVNYAAKNFDMSPMSNGVEMVRAKFSALEVIAVTALANITNSAVNTGKRLISAITIDPIKSGFAEYETQMNAVQTILANTQKEGTNVKIVNAALDDLNNYADKTIYNFTEMTHNIGTFTAAGVKLDTSVSAIKGIANLAAVSGSSSQQASTAMYQLSQAISSGTVKLMDWNSVVNAGMGGQVFQDALIRTSEHLKTGAKAAVAAKGSFRESLQAGWLTTEVLTQTLDQFATAADTQEEYEAAVKKFIEQGYSKEEAKQMADMAKTAGDAATKVKTFSQLIDTLKEALGSGWTESWRLIVGDFEEAKELWTQASDYFSEVINKSSNARNELLKTWANTGGRTMVIDSFKNAFYALLRIINPIKESFREVFPRTTSDQLLKITKSIKDFTENLKISDKTADKLKRTFKGIFSVFDIFKKVLVTVGKSIANLLGSDDVSSLGNFLLDITASIGDLFTSINESFSTDGISGLLKGAVDSLGSFDDLFSSIGDSISNVASKIWNALKSIFGLVVDNLSIGKIFGSIGGIFAFLSGKKLFEVAKGIKEFFDSIFNKDVKKSIGFLDDVKEKFTGILNSVHDSLESFVSGIKVSSLLSIASAIGILSASMNTISKLSVPDITKSLTAIGIMLVILSKTLKSMTKTLDGSKAKGIIKSAAAMMIMAKAIDILAKAMVKMAGLSWNEIAKGLVGAGGGLAELVAGIKFLDGVKVSLRTSIAMFALAKACEMLGDAVEKFGSMKWNDIGRGLTGMGGAIAELVAALGILSKIGGGGSLLGSFSVLIAVQSLSKMADGLKKFGDITWDEIKHGLVGMGGALTELAGISGALGKIAGFSGIVGSGTILIAVQSLDELAKAFGEFGDMSWYEIKHGLVGMGGALTEVGVISGALGYLAGFTGLLGSVSLVLAIQGLNDLAEAFSEFGDMSWDEIGRGLVGMGGALTEVGAISGALGYLTNFAGLLGSGTLLLAVQGLCDIADAFKKFGEMSWGEIGRGLTAMGSALGETALGGVLNTFSGFGATAISKMASSLGTLADSVKKWSGVSVPEGLGIQLGNLAYGVQAFTFGGWGAETISTIATDIGTLADSVKKWAGVTVPEGLGVQLADLSSGIASFTLAGWGSDAIATVASDLGTMADSVNKWSSVTVPDGLSGQLNTLATGVKAFTFGSWGANTIATIAPGLGQLADSISKWSTVKIPEGIGGKLEDIAKGVKEFSFAFVGSWSISSIIGPLGNLADAIKKWNGINVPKSLKEDLSNIADGIKKFSLAFIGGWSLSAITGPLGDLAISVNKWNGVNVPEGLGIQLSDLATGAKAFAGIGDISIASTGIGSIADSIFKLSTVNFSVISAGFISIVQSITNLSLIGPSIAVAAQQISSVVSSMITNFVTTINASQFIFSTAGYMLMNQFNTAIITGGNVVFTSINTFISRIVSFLMSRSTLFYSAGIILMERLKNGIISCGSGVLFSVQNIVNNAANTIKGYYQSFYDAGVYLGEGLIEGIKSKEQDAYNAGYALGQAAVRGEKDGQKSNSPSKLTIKAGKWLGEGLVIGMNRMGESVYNAGKNIGSYAIDSISGALNKVSDCVNTDLNITPTIRPVVDMNSIQTGTLNIGANLDKFMVKPVDSLSQIVSDAQNKINASNLEVINAINGLRDDLNTMYDSDTEIGLYVDSKKLASSIAKPMNRQLNILAKRGAY